MHLGFLDLLLLVGVTAQSAVIAYTHSPKVKALLLVLPIPFTLTTLALGRPVDATNVLGSLLLLSFAHLVRWLHYRWKMRIVPSIALSAIFYCVVGAALAPWVPTGDGAFYAAFALALVASAALLRLTPRVDEPGHRTPLPVYVKAPAIGLLVFALILLKRVLAGFMTVFPYVTVFGAYESRHSLWTLCRQVPINTLLLLVMMLICRLLQSSWGLGSAMAVSWAAFGALLIPLVYIATRPLAREALPAGSA